MRFPTDTFVRSNTGPGRPAARRPSLADTLVYLDRWLPGTLRRVKAITEKCTGIDGHASPPG
jgi:hypothetical protein